MPYYDLRCASCQTAFSVKASIQARSEKSIRCPSCTSTELETVYRQVNILKYRDQNCDTCSGEAPSCAAGGCCGGHCLGQ
ncbi:MAG: zinc ribbon domain-containing protein [Clostridiaceae bacterium]|nr:zinc ribbon domain-containing protein [Clostridiaceae bacterium]